jgi:hypothetical protein
MDEDLVYTTDHGGELKRVGGRLVFTKQPNYMGIKVGDPLPANWRLLPKDDATLKSMEEALKDNGPLNDEDIVIS